MQAALPLSTSQAPAHRATPSSRSRDGAPPLLPSPSSLFYFLPPLPLEPIALPRLVIDHTPPPFPATHLPSAQAHMAALRQLAAGKEAALLSHALRRRDEKRRELLGLQQLVGSYLPHGSGNGNGQPKRKREEDDAMRPLSRSITRPKTHGAPLIPPALLEEGKAEALRKASQDAAVLNRVAELQREGLWSARRLAKIPEPPRVKSHWDYLLEEMAWLANDFIEERKWKQSLAKKVSRQVLKRHQAIKTKEERESRKGELQVRKVAATIARDVTGWWQTVEKLVLHKHQSKLDEKKQRALDKHLDFLVGQTERYSTMLAGELVSAAPLPPQPPEDVGTEAMVMEAGQPGDETADQGDEYSPKELGEEDDESTLLEEERLAAGSEAHETDLLQSEANLPLEELLASYGLSMPGQQAAEDPEKARLQEAAALANEAQPRGNTFSTTEVKTKVPFLLKHSLREYQHIGLDWLVTMNEKRLNGILADEMVSNVYLLPLV
jgi:hypothetical protein